MVERLVELLTPVFGAEARTATAVVVMVSVVAIPVLLMLFLTLPIWWKSLWDKGSNIVWGNRPHSGVSISLASSVWAPDRLASERERIFLREQARDYFRTDLRVVLEEEFRKHGI